MTRHRVISILGAVALAATACSSSNSTTGPGTSGPPDLTGSWTITKYQFVSVAHPTTTYDVIANGYTGVAVLSDAAKTWSVTVTQGSTVINQAAGTYTETATTLTFNQTGQSPSTFSFSKSGNTVTLTDGTNSSYDFGNGSEPATVNITFTKTS